MPEVHTKLRISADDRDILKAGKSIRSAFSPASLRQFQQATKALEQQFSGLLVKQTALAKQLKGVDAGSKAYKDLGKEIKAATDELAQLEKAINQVDRVQQRAARQQQFGGRRSFVAGMAQGLGIAQFVPTGPGMGQRVAGAMVGGAARRVGGGAAAPFLMPGASGMAQAMGAIPGAGPGMAAGLNMMVSAVQEAVGFERARMQNMFFLRGFQGKAIPPDKVAIEAAERELIAAKTQRSLATKGKGMYGAEAGATSEALQKEQRVAAAMAEATAKAMPGSPLLGGTFATGRRTRGFTRAGAAVERDLEDAKTRVKSAEIRLEQEKNPGRKTLEAMGVQMGLGPMQTQELLGQFMGARGGMAGGAQDQIQEAMAAQLRFGVGPQQAGMFARMQMAGGGGTQGASLAATLQGAFVTGLEGSQIPEFLETLVELGQSAEQRGLKLDPQEFVKMSMSLGKAGFEGLQAKRVAGGFIESNRSLAERGVQSPMDVLMLRAAGFRPEQGPEGYAKAIGVLQDPAMQQMVMANAIQSISQGAGTGPEMRKLNVMRAFQTRGVSISMEQAGRVLASQDAGLGMPQDISGMLAKQAAQGGAAGMIGEAIGDVPGVAQRAAQTELERVRLGQREEVSEAVRGFERNAILLSGGVGNLSGTISKVNEAVKTMMDAFGNFTSYLNELLGGNAKRPSVPAGG